MGLKALRKTDKKWELPPPLALMHAALSGSSARQIFAPKPNEVIEIPYMGIPGSDLRRRIAKLDPKFLLVVFTPALAFSFALLIYTFMSLANYSHLSMWLVLPIAFNNTLLALSIFAMLSLRDSIVADQFGLDFSRAGTGHALIYYWTDMESVNIVDKPKRGKHRFFLEVRFKNRRPCKLELSKLPPESLELLADTIEKRAPFCRNVSQLSELKRFRDFELGLLPGVSYTQLWESLTNKNIELTGFAPLSRGTTLRDGQLTVIRQLASGGFSAVYLVENDEGVKQVLKESILPFDTDPELAEKASEQFEREARLLTALRHDQIARVYDFFVEHNRKYMLLEYIPGQTLKELVYEKGPQAPDKALSYALQIAGILEFLHQQPTPIVHRDIAPDNLIVSEWGKVFLIDFGSANEFVGNATGTLVGKHAYMAPEQIRGKATPLSDLYSLGQTMFYMLEGGQPSPLSSSSLSNAKTLLMTRMDKVIRKLTELDHQLRPQSAREVMDLLEACLTESASAGSK